MKIRRNFNADDYAKPTPTFGHLRSMEKYASLAKESNEDKNTWVNSAAEMRKLSKLDEEEWNTRTSKNFQLDAGARDKLTFFPKDFRALYGQKLREAAKNEGLHGGVPIKEEVIVEDASGSWGGDEGDPSLEMIAALNKMKKKKKKKKKKRNANGRPRLGEDAEEEEDEDDEDDDDEEDEGDDEDDEDEDEEEDEDEDEDDEPAAAAPAAAAAGAAAVAAVAGIRGREMEKVNEEEEDEEDEDDELTKGGKEEDEEEIENADYVKDYLKSSDDEDDDEEENDF